nr:alpha/beta hydrolase [uncultured Clostridium sp.]
MIFKDFGNINAPTILLLHGGGLSDWSLEGIVTLLTPEYHVVTPIIEGYGEDVNEVFMSIEKSAHHLIEYVMTHCNGHIFALGGLSIGAQIVTEVLSQNANISDFAIIESALVCPIWGTRLLAVPMCQLSYRLIKKRWFSKLQARQLCVSDTMFEKYYSDSIKISKQTLVNTILSNGTYKMKAQLKNTTAKVLVIVGEKEITVMQKSAEILHQNIQNSQLYIAPNMKHGELSMTQPKQYVEQLQLLFTCYFNS